MNAGLGDWPVARQEQLLAAARMRSVLPRADADGLDPVNVECLTCGGAQADSLDGISDGLRLSRSHCNAARFSPTTSTIGDRFTALGLLLLDEFDGDPGRPLQALCRRARRPGRSAGPRSPLEPRRACTATAPG